MKAYAVWLVIQNRSDTKGFSETCVGSPSEEEEKEEIHELT